jgi:ribosomal protein L37AE/L43A
MWNDLVQADCEHRKRVETAIMHDRVDYAEAINLQSKLNDDLWALIHERRARRAKERKKIETPELDGQIKDASNAIYETRSNVWRLAKEWRLDNKEKMQQLEQQRRAKNKKVRQQTLAYWGNYNRVSDDFDRARSKCMKQGRTLRPKEVDCDRGCLTVQIQSTKSGVGASMSELMDGTFNQFQIERIPEHVQYLPSSARSRECKTIVTMRVDRDGNMVKFPAWIHRLPPANTRIKSAKLVWHREGEKIVGSICLTVSGQARSIEHHGKAACGIDLGWRLEKEGGLRVATVFDSAGNEKIYHLPPDWMGGMDQVERLQSHVDDDLLVLANAAQNIKMPDAIAGTFKNWKPGLGSRHVDVKTLHDTIRQAEDRGVLPSTLIGWYKRYRHLSLWRDNLRAKLLRRRRELYRLIAIDISHNYAVIGMENMNLSAMSRTKKKDDGEDNELHSQSRANRVRAGVSILRSEIEHQAKKFGSELIYVSGPSTMNCHLCGKTTKQRERDSLLWTCQHCGAQWDQDKNAAKNIYDAAVAGASANIEEPENDEKTKVSKTVRIKKSGALASLKNILGITAD